MLVRDRRKMEELWDQLYQAWFPQGLEEPGEVTVRVQARIQQ